MGQQARGSGWEEASYSAAVKLSPLSAGVLSGLSGVAARRLLKGVAAASLLSALLPSAQAVNSDLNLFRSPPLSVPFRAAELPACLPPTTPTELALWQNAPASERPLACGNRYVGHYRFPPTTERPSFALLGQDIEAARAEVLIANMDWEMHEGSPALALLDSIAKLYARVKANPAAYPQGMRVRLQVGAIILSAQRQDAMDEPIAMARYLGRRGIPVSDPALGWTVAVNAWQGYPHSHVKMLVIDGKRLDTGGYNLTRWFNPLSSGVPSSSPNWGMGVQDERIVFEGPLALAGVWAFDDLWRQGKELSCTPQQCQIVPGQPGTHPDYAALNGAWTAGDAGYTFSLYERLAYTRAQRSLEALLRAARDTIDIDQASLSPEIFCTFGYLSPEGCGPETWPSYLGLLRQAWQRGVKVRIALNRADALKMGNLAAAALLVQQSRLDYASQYLELRWHPEGVRAHNKVILVDSRLPGGVLVTGSLNLHYSSWGDITLAEHSLATSNPSALAEARRFFEDRWAQTEPAQDQDWMVPAPEKAGRSVTSPAAP